MLSVPRLYHVVGDDGKTIKYATGEALLFHIKEDLHEQHNLFHDPGYIDIRDSLDALLTQAITRSMLEANFGRRVYTRDLSQYSWFGREGWQRPYRRSVQDR
jgi:hypothetical protein